MVRSTVEQTLNDMLDAEADQLCGDGRYERTEARIDGRAGHYKRKLHTKAGEVELKMPKLRKSTIFTEIAWKCRSFSPPTHPPRFCSDLYTILHDRYYASIPPLLRSMLSRPLDLVLLRYANLESMFNSTLDDWLLIRAITELH